MLLRSRFTILLSLLSVAIVSLSAAFHFELRPLAAQTDIVSTCSSGTAVLNPTDNPGLVSDCETLLAGRDILAGDATLNWSANTPMTQWDGVTIDGNPPRVTKLDFLERGMTGEIPVGLADLSNLMYLNLRDNRLTGSIPTELGSLSNLKVLDLSSSLPENNQLIGTIPSQLGNLTQLQTLSLGRNRLTGEIPESLGDLLNLRDLA